MTRFQSHRLTLSAIAAGLCALACAQSVHAAEFVSSSSIGIDHLRFRLVDLAPDDGIDPSLTIAGNWLISQGLDGWHDTLLNAPSSLFGAGDVTTGTADDGSITYAFGPQGVSVGSVLDGQQDGIVNDHEWITTENVTGEDGKRYTRTRTTRTVSAMIDESNVGYVHLVPPANAENGSIWGQLTLSANTVLILDGVVSGAISVDRSVVARTVAGLSQAREGETVLGEGYSNVVGRSSAYLGISLIDTSNDNLGNGFSGGDAVGSSSRFGGMVDYDAQGFLNADGTVDEAMTRSQSVSEDFSMSFTNLSAQTRTLELGFEMNAAQSYEIQKFANFVKLGPLVEAAQQPPIDVPPVTGVPEPGSFALMGLGLVGLSLARRRSPQA